MKHFNEKGAISLSDFFLAGIAALFIGALSVPFILGQQSDMNEKAAQIDARSIATEVELFLQSHPNITIEEPIAISHNSATQELFINAPGYEADATKIKLSLSDGSSLPLSVIGTDDKANLLISPSEYCITVDSFGRSASHNQNGPTGECK
jgi:hypothetical protein